MRCTLRQIAAQRTLLAANVAVIDTEKLRLTATVPAVKGAWGVAVGP